MTRWRKGLVALLLTLAAGAAAAGHGDGSDDWQVRLDHWVRYGFNRPDAALAELQRDTTWADTPEWARLTAHGSVLAVDGQADRDARALAIADRLRVLAQRSDERLALVGAHLIDALRFERQGRFELAAPHAREVLSEHNAVCVRTDGQTARTGCSWRLAWRAHLILSQYSVRVGVLVDAQAQMAAAQRLAHANAGALEEAHSAALMASLHSLAGDAERASASLDQARLMARALPAADELWVRLKITESRLERARGRSSDSLDMLLQARSRAEAGNLPRTEATVQANLSDAWIRAGRPKEALVAAEWALPVVQQHRETRTERVLRHNIVLARLALGQLGPARRDLDAVLDLWRSSGAQGDEVEALRELADALAKAGDAKAALVLYHRERELSAEIARLNRDSMLRELRARNDQAAKQREIELLRKEAEVQAAQLANRGLLQSLWAVAAFGLLLAMLALALLITRVRRARSTLVRSRVRLRAQSERDALTGLANRHHALGQVRARGFVEHYAGALLLLDVDHFKRINDEHGHAAGDAVLVEVAARLADVLREQDLAVRWGGEEFLVIAPDLPPARTAVLAERIRRAVARVPVRVGHSAIRVEVSVGHAHFPLPAPAGGTTPPLIGWERALNLVDLLLYVAKGRGRNSTVGIDTIVAADDAALQAIERDFESACFDGRVRLAATGPASAGVAAPERRQPVAA